MGRNRRLTILVLMLLVGSAFIITAAGCGAATTGSDATSASTAESTVKAGTGTSDTNASTQLTKVKLLLCVPVKTIAMFMAIIPSELGYYEDEGLDVSVETTDGSTFVVTQLSAGSADAGVVIAGPMISAWAANQKLVYIYDTLSHPVFSVIVPEDSAVQSYADLEGKTIGLKEAMGGDVPELKTKLATAGIVIGQNLQQEVVGSDWNVIFDKFNSGEIAAYSASYNDLTSLLNKPDMAYRVIDPEPDATAMHPLVPLVVTEDFYNNHKEAAVGLARAMAKAIVFAKANPDAALAILKKEFPPEHEDPAYTRAYMDVAVNMSWPLKDDIPFGQISIDGTKDLIKAMVAPGEASGLQAEFDPTPFMAPDLVTSINAFDEATVEADAKASTLTYP